MPPDNMQRFIQSSSNEVSYTSRRVSTKSSRSHSWLVIYQALPVTVSAFIFQYTGYKYNIYRPSHKNPEILWPRLG